MINFRKNNITLYTYIHIHTVNSKTVVFDSYVVMHLEHSARKELWG